MIPQGIDPLMFALLPLGLYAIFIIGPILSGLKGYALVEDVSHLWWLRAYFIFSFLVIERDRSGTLRVKSLSGEGLGRLEDNGWAFLAMFAPLAWAILIGLSLTFELFAYTVLTFLALFAGAFVVRQSVLKFRAALEKHNEDKEAHSNMRSRHDG